MKPIALSTCWLSHRHQDGYDMLREIADLGFQRVELSHGIRISLVPGILKAVDEGFISVGTVHNFCPLPPGVTGAAPNLYQPTARNATERDLWFRYTIKTFDFAHRVGADLVVMHSGSIPFWFFDPEAKLEKVAGDTPPAELLALESYQKQWHKVRRKLERGAIRHLQLLKDSYARVIEFAKIKNVQLGIENREGVQELPLDHAMAQLLADLTEPDIFGYWHDAGHAQLKERAGIIAHRALLEANSARQFGFHLHDVCAEGKDHQEPGTGTVDWAMLRTFVRPEHRLVLELSPRLSAEAVVRSHDFLNALLVD